MTNSTKPAPTNQDLEQRVHQLAQDSGNVVITDHCDLRMEERGITWTEAIRCLRRGSIVGQPQYNPKFNTWEFKMREAPPRDIVCLVAAVCLDPASREVIAITVYEV